LIFVTIGSLFPFDRLIRAMDDLAISLPEESFFAQIGDGTYVPRNMPYARMVPRREFAERVRGSKMLVAHAGMGSVITALELARPVILLPRRYEHGEHNTDHQMATARWLTGKRGVHVCLDDQDLGNTVRQVLAAPDSADAMSTAAPPAFTDRIRACIDAG